MCRLLGVQSHNYYSYQKRQSVKPDDMTQQELQAWVNDIAKFSDNTYGERGIQKSIKFTELTSESQENITIDEISRCVGKV